MVGRLMQGTWCGASPSDPARVGVIVLTLVGCATSLRGLRNVPPRLPPRGLLQLAQRSQLLHDLGEDAAGQRFERPHEAAIVDGPTLVDHHFALVPVARAPGGSNASLLPPGRR